MRTTVDIAPPVMRELKRLQKRTGRSLGGLVSELLSQALASRAADDESKGPALRWTVGRMGKPLVDLRDKEAVRRALDDAR
jgi:hypothetical protein